MKDEMTIKQHYVPQFYLKNFAENIDGKLWVYDRKEKKYFKSTPKNICYKKYLYETSWENANPKLGEYILPNKIEKDFAKNEGKYSSLLKRIISICNNSQNAKALICSTDEKKVLASFVINMILRNPWSLKQAEIDVIKEEIIENDEIKTIDLLLQEINLGGTKSLIKIANKKVWLDENFDGSVPQQLIEEILGLNCIFLFSENYEFVTSDFPICYETYDLKDNITCFKTILIPICPYIAIIYSNASITKPFRNRLKIIKEKEVKIINQKYLEYDIDQARFLLASNRTTLSSSIC